MRTSTRALAGLALCAMIVVAGACSSEPESETSTTPTTAAVSKDTSPGDVAAVLTPFTASLDGHIADMQATDDSATARASVGDTSALVTETGEALSAITTTDKKLAGAINAFLSSASAAIDSLDEVAHGNGDITSEEVATTVGAINTLWDATSTLEFAAATAAGDKVGGTAPSAATVTDAQITKLTADDEITPATARASSEGVCSSTTPDAQQPPSATSVRAVDTNNFSLSQRTRVFASDADADEWLTAFIGDAQACDTTPLGETITNADVVDEAFVLETTNADGTSSAMAVRVADNVVFTMNATVNGNDIGSSRPSVAAKYVAVEGAKAAQANFGH